MDSVLVFPSKLKFPLEYYYLVFFPSSIDLMHQTSNFLQSLTLYPTNWCYTASRKFLIRNFCCKKINKFFYAKHTRLRISIFICSPLTFLHTYHTLVVGRDTAANNLLFCKLIQQICFQDRQTRKVNRNSYQDFYVNQTRALPASTPVRTEKDLVNFLPISEDIHGNGR